MSINETQTRVLEARTRAILTLRSRSGLNTEALGALTAYELATLGPNPVAADSAIRFAARILLSPYSDAIINALGLDDRTNRHLTLTARRNEFMAAICLISPGTLRRREHFGAEHLASLIESLHRLEDLGYLTVDLSGHPNAEPSLLERVEYLEATVKRRLSPNRMYGW